MEKCETLDYFGIYFIKKLSTIIHYQLCCVTKVYKLLWYKYKFCESNIKLYKFAFFKCWKRHNVHFWINFDIERKDCPSLGSQTPPEVPEILKYTHNLF